MFSSSELEVQVAHSIEQVGQEAWDHLSAHRPFASFNWYRFGEAVLADNIPVYIILSQKSRPIARATFWLRRREQLPVSSRAARYLLQALLYRRPLLVCRSPVADRSGLILPDPPLCDEALQVIAQIAQKQAHQYKASFLAFDYLERQEAEGLRWPEAFVLSQVTDPGMRLTITWPDFESYMEHLPKSVRRDYRRHCKRAADQGVEIKLHPLIQPLDEATCDEAVTLIRNVEKHHHSAPNPWAGAMLKHADLLGATWLRAEIGNRLVGCCILLGDEDNRMMTLLGLDYDVPYTYFQLMYEPIRCAIEGGARIVWGGSGAYEIKQRLGFETVHNDYVAFATKNRVLRWAVRRLATG